MERFIKSLLRRFAFGRRLDAHMLEVLSGSPVVLALRLLGAGLTFCFNLLLARALGAEGTGVYYLCLTVTMVATVFGRLGLDNALLRFASANAAVSDWPALKGLYSKGMTQALAASAMAALAMFVAAPFLADQVFMKPDLAVPMRWMSMAVVPLTLVLLHGQLLKGLKRIKSSVLVDGMGIPAISLGLLYFIGDALGMSGPVWAYVVACASAAAAGYVLWRRSTPQLRGVEGRFDGRELRRSSIPLFWVACTNLVMNWFAMFMLGISGTSADVGVFGVASRTAMFTSFVLFAVNSIVAPKFAEFYRKGDLASVGSIARNSTRLVTVMASPLLLLFTLAPGLVMGLFGPQFAGGGAVLAILAAGQFVNVATGSVAYLLMMSGNERTVRNVNVLVALANVCLNALLVPAFGVIGAAAATAFSLAATNLVFTWLVYKKFAILTLPIPHGQLQTSKR